MAPPGRIKSADDFLAMSSLRDEAQALEIAVALCFAILAALTTLLAFDPLATILVQLLLEGLRQHPRVLLIDAFVLLRRRATIRILHFLLLGIFDRLSAT